MGCSAGFLNFPRIKGVHNAMLSGMAAAQSVAAAIAAGREHDQLLDYTAQLEQAGVLTELRQVRNIKPALAKLGTLAGTLYAGADLWLAHFGLSLPWTLHSKKSDHSYQQDNCTPIKYPKPDGVLTFSKLDSLTLANVSHEHDQPVHLQLRNPELITPVHLSDEIKAECHYCPAGVYEIVELAGQKKYQINAQNCLHCKTCDIKDRQQNIHWVTPEGSGGPMYTGM
jgi:electron-transferring-flavoprotein dehydrogenase